MLKRMRMRRGTAANTVLSRRQVLVARPPSKSIETHSTKQQQMNNLQL